MTQRTTRRAKLRPIRLHDLRRTTATLLKDLGVPVRDTMEILGHSRIAVTLEIYTGADDASRREAIQLLNRLFEGRSARLVAGRQGSDVGGPGKT